MSDRRKRSIVTALVVFGFLLVGGFIFYQWGGQNRANQKFRTVKVERGEISLMVTATGTINPVITVLVGSQVSGTIKALYADFNSLVKEGQVIAQIDPAIFEAQVEQGRANVLSAQANVLNAQANLKSAQANLEKAEVSVLDTRRTLERNKELMEKKAIAQASLDTAQTNYDSAVAQRELAKAQLESARSQVESTKAQLEQAKAALKMAETNMRYTTIRSPVNGIVISRNVDVGQTVAASLQAPTLFTIAKDLTQMQVNTSVSEADIGRIAKGQEATFTVDAYPEKAFHGKVSEIRNAPSIIQNVVTYDVVIQVDNRELKLKPGMTANVSVMIAHKEGVLRIPNAALRYRPEFAKATTGEGVGKKNVESRKKETAAVKGTGGPPQGGMMLRRLTEALSLTPEQQSKVEMVLESSRQEFQEIRERVKPEEARGKIQSLLRQKIIGLLTEEQRQKWQTMWSEQVQDGRPARVWVLSSEGKPVPASVALGITDGTFSEMISGDLKEGTEVIVEEISKKKAQTRSGSPPPSMRGFR